MARPNRVKWRAQLQYFRKKLFVWGDSQLEGVADVRLNLQNKFVEVYTDQILSQADKAGVENDGAALLRSLASGTSSWKLIIRRMHTYPFTSHLNGLDNHSGASAELPNITEIRITVEELLAINAFYESIPNYRTCCRRAQFFATFALGGVPAIMHLAEYRTRHLHGLSQQEQKRELVTLQDQMHLFPGLQWHTDAPSLFFEWLIRLPDKSRVMLFDTGHVGHAPLQLLNLLRDRLPKSEFCGPRTIVILGIVDRESRKQKAQSARLQTFNGQHVRVSMAFKHVPKVLTEDCPILIGLDSVRHQLAGVHVRSMSHCQLEV